MKLELLKHAVRARMSTVTDGTTVMQETSRLGHDLFEVVRTIDGNTRRMEFHALEDPNPSQLGWDYTASLSADGINSDVQGEARRGGDLAFMMENLERFIVEFGGWKDLPAFT